MKIVKFETINCTPCKMVDMMMKDIGISVDEVINVVESPELAEKYGVMKVPQLILLDDNGIEIDRLMDMKSDKVKEIFGKAGKI